jgi:hypothetical protein
MDGQKKALVCIGRLNKASVQDDLLSKTLEFVWSNLAPWRDDPDRQTAVAEEELNAQLANFLQAQAIHNFPMVQFQHEQRQTGRRRVDLSVKPSSPVIICETYFSIYTPITVMEGKRLPAPDKIREKEYVTGGHEMSGGIQRFRLGLHGKDHDTVVLIAYLQKEHSEYWNKMINNWICAFAESNHGESWNTSELLADFHYDKGACTAKATSIHPRHSDCVSETIQIKHFWVELDRAQENPINNGRAPSH